MSIVIFENAHELKESEKERNGFSSINLGVMILSADDFLVVRDRNSPTRELISREELIKRVESRIDRNIELREESLKSDQKNTTEELLSVLPEVLKSGAADALFKKRPFV